MEEGGGLEPPRLLHPTVFKTATGRPQLGLSFQMEAGPGVEPGALGYEPNMLPLHYPAMVALP